MTCQLRVCIVTAVVHVLQATLAHQVVHAPASLSSCPLGHWLTPPSPAVPPAAPAAPALVAPPPAAPASFPGAKVAPAGASSPPAAAASTLRLVLATRPYVLLLHLLERLCVLGMVGQSQHKREKAASEE